MNLSIVADIVLTVQVKSFRIASSYTLSVIH